MEQHGFARNLTFELVTINKNAARFELRATDQTKVIYPFDFVLGVEYILVGEA